jgi:A/G-specific adenine glycosylase
MVRHSRTKTKRQSHSSDDSDYAEDCHPRKRTKASAATAKGKKTAEPDLSDSLEQEITGVGEQVAQHPKSLHDLHHVSEARKALLQWFAGVHDAREMPWRKPFNPNLSPERRNQRAYEVCVFSFQFNTVDGTVRFRSGYPRSCSSKPKWRR